ncbi:unnamed protein product [Aureobasidium mustum]|uniref:Uncharacterized protein n=1 Tax=Aureobasidium mustum TaxID=2773714 RepID=A0A9N8PDA1_9PEZI|nr:unnamed protein product [Aureobasidium mustum]
MCYHRYTSHPCGHKSRSLGKCTIDTLATQVPFCDHYHVLNDRSLTSCGGSYCKEDKETAHWVENGSTLLEACHDDLADLKYRLQTLHRELQAASDYKNAFGSLQGKEVDRVRSKHDEYEELRQIYKETRDRRQLILDGIQKAKEKRQAEHTEKMRRVQQYVNTHKPQSALAASPQGPPKTNHMFEGRRLMKRADSKVVSNPSPPKKRRGRPPKAKQMDAVEVPTQSTPEVPSHDAQPNKDKSPMANNQNLVPKRQSTRHNSTKESPVQHTSAAAVRRSGRTKQRVSYAESPTSSPEHSASEQPEYDLGFTGVSQSKRSTIATRATRNKESSQQDEFYATDEDDNDEEDHGLNEDGAWQGDEGAEEDNMELEPTPIQKARSSAKRNAASPPSSSRPTKRLAAIASRDTTHRGFDPYSESESIDVNGQHDVPGLDHGWAYTTAHSTTSKGAYDMPWIPGNHNLAIENKYHLLHHTKPVPDELTSNAMNLQGQNPDDPDMSPLRRSDWLNGLGRAGMVVSLADFHDTNNYDFDVSAMSMAVADLNAQQG